jgi:hypothetical protein
MEEGNTRKRRLLENEDSDDPNDEDYNSEISTPLISQHSQKKKSTSKDIRQNSQSQSTEQPTEVLISSLKARTMKLYCLHLGLEVSGKKPELIDRLTRHYKGSFIPILTDEQLQPKLPEDWTQEDLSEKLNNTRRSKLRQLGPKHKLLLNKRDNNTLTYLDTFKAWVTPTILDHLIVIQSRI